MFGHTQGIRAGQGGRSLIEIWGGVEPNNDPNNAGQSVQGSPLSVQVGYGQYNGQRYRFRLLIHPGNVVG
jgi:hypothetical protein